MSGNGDWRSVNVILLSHSSADICLIPQQEHNMKAKNGGVGMSDEEVKAFIGRYAVRNYMETLIRLMHRYSRYMPGYELFLDGLSGPSAPWHGNGLRLVLNDKRDVVAEEAF